MFITAPLAIIRFFSLPFLLFSLLTITAHAEDAPEKTPPAYIEIRPQFVVNFESDTARLRYIKTSITLQTDAGDKALIEENMPLVKDALVMFLSSRTSDQVTGAQAREKTRIEAAKDLNKVLKEETGKEPVKSVLFGSFLTQ
ncbi:flagellar basal body-associated protein FliL-like protein [Marinomonas spartinae]|uniref:flagellar basal body-associated FliL family protein n=1 Tax=Marinomonas spartinae TaxID=1792290 RepID=UPI000809065F|nr:flagellar basal body-associated FliL family protein [Marinomonas spartinae]SBS40396.1 flagellar basal body-associated protein FliL-like protein [Marinomonas spartinae]